MKKTYRIEVDCANCANKVEAAAARTPGVKSAVVNFMLQKLILEFDDGEALPEVMALVVKNCKRVTQDFEIFL